MVGARSIAGLALFALAFSTMASIEVSVDRNPVRLNDTFQLVFELDESPDRDPDFSALRENFLVLGNNRSSSISIINGNYRSSVKWTLQLMARDVGEFEIPAIRFDDELSEPLRISVNPAQPGSLPEDQLALEMQADSSEAYVQSQVVLTLRLLSAVDIAAYQFGDIQLDNLDTVAEPLGDVRQYQTRVDDKAYLVLEKRFALFAQQSGLLKVSPVFAEVRLPSRRAYDPFQTSGEVRRLRSQPVTIEIKPIPAGYDAPYWLPARKLELREQWQDEPGNLVVGEPLTRSLTLLAEGLTAAQLPELRLEPIDGIKQYPDQPSLDNQRTNAGIRGSREQKVALIPGSAGRYLLPPVELPWWNLETGRQEVARLPAREVRVLPAADAGIEAPPPETPLETPASAPAAVAPVPAVSEHSPWPWVSLALACGWLLSLLYWWFGARRSTSAPIASAERLSLRRARRELQRACDADDAAAARAALLAWGRALLAPQPIANLRQLCALLGDDLVREVEELNRSRYAHSHAAWRGSGLWQVCRQLEAAPPRDAGAANDLLPLNPR